MLSRGATGQLAFPRAGVWGEDPRGRRPGASPLDCSSCLFCLEAGMPGESEAQAQRRRDEKPPSKGRLQSALLPSPLFQTGPPPCCRCREKQLEVTLREDQKVFLRYICVSHTLLGNPARRFPRGSLGARREGRMLVWRCLPVAAREGWRGDPPLPAEEVWAPLGHGAGRGR